MNKEVINSPIVNSMQQPLQEITIQRVYALFSLVLFHTLCIFTSESWGGVRTGMYSHYSEIIAWLIPEANMPLFTFIAGYLMGYQLENNKYEQFALFVKKKARRLLVPYILFGALMIIAQPGLGEWRNLLYGNPNHMWYCLMLFYCYVAYYILSKYTKEWITTSVAIMSLLLIIRYGFMWTIVHKFHYVGGLEIAAYHFFWFWLGAIIFKYRDVLYSKSCFAAMLILYIFTHSLLKEIAFILLIFLISMWISKEVKIPTNVKKAMECLARCGMGIYILHHMILWDVIHIDAISQYVVPLCERHDVIMPIGLFSVTFGLSWLITYLSLRTKVGRNLL